jgi:cysteine-rich repeat protein
MGGAAGAGQGGGGGVPEPECGDGTVDAGEQCDDDNVMPLDGCDANCDRETGWSCVGTMPTSCTPICGDGIMVGAEVCDDGNAVSCGTCAGNAAGTLPGCTTVVTPTAATGSIVAVGGADLMDGETFVVGDGSTAITFEFDNDVMFTSGRTPIIFTGAEDAATVGTAIAAAINLSSLEITASGTATVMLTNDVTTSLGNVPITETVAAAGFTVTGMSGGRARNCASGVACNDDADCASGDCNSSNLCTN